MVSPRYQRHHICASGFTVVVFCQEVEMTTLGDYIRDKRKAAGLTQMQACTDGEFSITAWSSWERDKVVPDVGRLKIIAGVIGVEPAEIAAVAMGAK